MRACLTAFEHLETDKFNRSLELSRPICEQALGQVPDKRIAESIPAQYARLWMVFICDEVPVHYQERFLFQRNDQLSSFGLWQPERQFEIENADLDNDPFIPLADLTQIDDGGFFCLAKLAYQS